MESTPSSLGLDKQPFQTAWEHLQSAAKGVVADEPEIRWLPSLRNTAAALNLDLDVKDSDLQALLDEAIRADEPCAFYREGEQFRSRPAQFLIDGLIRTGGSNVIVGQPKVGKSTLVLGLIAALRDGASTFLGRQVNTTRTNIPVLVFGTDQQEADWIPYLQQEGLMTAEQHMLSPLKLFAPTEASNRFNFTRAGVQRMKAEVMKHDAPLVVIDSLTSMMEPTGMDENLSQFSGPIRHAIKELSVNGATLVILHHTTKRVTCWDWIEACRGSSSISSVFSWGVLARWLVPDNETHVRLDTRVGITAKGRGKSPDAGILAQYVDGQGWGLCGGLEEAQRVEALRQVEVELSGHQAKVYDSVVEQHHLGRDIATSDLATAAGLSTGHASRTIKALVSKGLVRCSRNEPTGARPRRFWQLTERAVLLIDHFQEPSGSNGSFGSFDDGSFADGQAAPRVSPIGSNGSFAPQTALDPKEPFNPTLGREEQPQTANQKIHPPLPAPNSPVERLIDGEWRNGWKLHHESTNPHAVIIWTEIGERVLTARNLRWDIDVRLCQAGQPAPLYEPFNPDTLDF